MFYTKTRFKLFVIPPIVFAHKINTKNLFSTFDSKSCKTFDIPEAKTEPVV